MQTWTLEIDGRPDACKGRSDESLGSDFSDLESAQIFFELLETHLWKEDSEIIGIPNYVATLHKNDFI